MGIFFWVPIVVNRYKIGPGYVLAYTANYMYTGNDTDTNINEASESNPEVELCVY